MSSLGDAIFVKVRRTEQITELPKTKHFIQDRLGYILDAGDRLTGFI